ncbi:MAG: hypothetical protein ACJ72J_08760 [Nitrososphaeraceae archaeon]
MEIPKQEDDNFTTVNISLRLPTNLYKVAEAISLLSGHGRFEDYLHKLIMADVEDEINGIGRLALTILEDDKKKLLEDCRLA